MIIMTLFHLDVAFVSGAGILFFIFNSLNIRLVVVRSLYGLGLGCAVRLGISALGFICGMSSINIGFIARVCYIVSGTLSI